MFGELCHMARTRGYDFRAVLAGTIICCGVAVAQEGAEVTEDLGNSYLLARRTTSLGSVIETLLFAGQAIVTEIAMPAPDIGITAATTGAGVARTTAGSANTGRGGVASLPPGLGPGFGGTLMSGEIVGDYLDLKRNRASGRVTHEIFHEGHKVGSFTEVGLMVETSKSPGRNSYTFESSDDRFVVHLTQPDGTRIRATTEHGRFTGQAVERTAAIAAPSRSVAMPPSPPPPEPIKPSLGRSPEPQRLTRPQESTDLVERAAPQVVAVPPEAVPLPRAFPKPRLRPTIEPTAVHPAGSSPLGNYRRTSAPTIAAPAAKPKPAVASASASPPAATRPAAPAATGALSGSHGSAAANVRVEPRSARAAQPRAPVAKPKPNPATADVRPTPTVAKRVTSAAKPSRSSPSGTPSQ